jgi:hypothetical protein
MRIKNTWFLISLSLPLWALLGGCAVTAGGYGDDVTVSYGVGFYEPWGYGYDGWNDGYRVGPPRGGERRREGAPHAYHAAHPSRSMPSIPTRARRHR